MLGAINKAEELKRETPNSYMPQQFENETNPQIHRQTTAQEILDSVPGGVDAFVAGVGTGGTLSGVAEVLKQANPKVKIVAVEPEANAVLSGEKPGPHKIQGIGPGFIPKVLNQKIIDEIIKVSDDQAFRTSQELAKKEGLFVGISSGAACWAGLKAAKDLGQGRKVVVIFPDTGERYSSMEQYFT
jgi:cysteine synthase A